MIKMASQADLWYNGVLNNVMSGGAANTPDRTHLLRRCIMDTLPPHGQNGNLSHVPIASGIYKITCTTNQKIYIGSALNLRRRYRVHFGALKQNKHHSVTLQRAFNKYGADAFIFEVLELILLPELLTAREQYWLDKFQSFNPHKGYNIAPNAGSSLGIKHSPEYSEKIRQANLRRGTVSQETRERMRQSHLGKKRSPESIEKSRQGRLGQKMSLEACEKLRQINLGNTYSLGRKHSPETIEKIRQAKLGKSNANLGKKHAPEWVEKTQKTYIVTDPDGVEHIVHGINQFCRQHNIDASGLVKVAKGKCKQYRGWKARYPSEDSDAGS